MGNTNTFARLHKLTGPTSSTETAIAARGSATVRATLGVRSDILTGLFDGFPFKLRVVSKALASGACNFTVNVYLNAGGNTNLTTFTNDVLVIGSGAQALASTSGVLYMQAILLWDSADNRLAAHWIDGAGLANIETTPAIIKSSGAVTAANPLATSIDVTSEMEFFVTHTMSANATSSQLLELALDQI